MDIKMTTVNAVCTLDHNVVSFVLLSDLCVLTSDCFYIARKT